MKVCTDACLFGAWVANTIQHLIPKYRDNIQNILDIGTGTGLLSLIIAQKNKNIIIDAVEIDESAAQQANTNFEKSPWANRLHIIQDDIRKVNLTKKYDLIISNPPFFQNHLKSNSVTKNLALHNQALSLGELLISIKNNLSNNGISIILLSYNHSYYFEELLINNQFYLNEKVLVKQTPNHNYFRNILTFSKQQTEKKVTSLIIQDIHSNYTPAFIELLKDYYLKL